MTIPRWGVHHEIKYSPRRSILKVCPVCNEFFLKNTKGRKEYCNELCSIKARKLKMREVNQRIIQNRDNFKHANYMRELYFSGSSNKRVFSIGTDNVPGIPVNDNGEYDWNSYGNMLRCKMQKMGLRSPH